MIRLSLYWAVTSGEGEKKMEEFRGIYVLQSLISFKKIWDK